MPPRCASACLLLVLASCAKEEPGSTKNAPVGPDRSAVDVADEGPGSGYQDAWFGNWKRGRGNVVADFDGDGDMDLFSGNPGNASFLIRNTTTGPGAPLSFTPWQILSNRELFYGGVAGDFDNDGDPDLFVSAGANDGPEFDRLYRNDLDQGAPSDSPLTDLSGQRLIAPEAPGGGAMPNGTMGVRAHDFDEDGLLDVWASNQVADWDTLVNLPPDDPTGLNQLYLGGPDLDFRDVAAEVGLSHRGSSRHATVFDFDRDGDLDIYENNVTGGSIFWRNRLAQDGVLSFEDATDALSLDGTSLHKPMVMQAMCSLPVDLDNDGWEDLLRLHRGTPTGEVQGHQVWMNQQGTGFVEVGEHTNLSARWNDAPEEVTSPGAMGWWGVMGCQVGDVDLDGFPDVFLGNGGGAAGEVNTLFLNRSRERVQITGIGKVTVPVFEDWTDLIDFPPALPGAPYPLRTHGTAFADFDGDGVDELGVHNGGPASRPAEEPNRLYRFDLPDPRFLRVRLVGDGDRIPTDAFDTRVRVTVERDRDDATWTLSQVKYSAVGFGAQNGPDLVFGLGDGDRVTAIEVEWPDGSTTSPAPPRGTRNWVTVAY